MCGIAGVAGREDEALVARMMAVLAHRGPDDAGMHTDVGVTLGHRRLSIIDLAGGHQPMHFGNGRYTIVFNGEIYNYRELRHVLEVKGHVFHTASDTEVILAAYAQYGDTCVEAFQGMFAFALWDREERSLFLARDPVGVKPLYYALVGDTLCFASEMKALMHCPGVEKAMDPQGLDDYLAFLYTVPPRTFYRDIRQLPPAHSATWKDGRFATRRYWQLDTTPTTCTPEAWIESVDAALAETVGRYLVSDVPLGAFLSGGLDSSAIVHYMKRHDQVPPRTFTIGFGREGALYDEAEEARALARHLGTEHHEQTVQADVAQLLPTMLAHFDEPFGNPTALLSYVLCQTVRKEVKVVLSGDGGDECFGGYPRYRGVQVAETYGRLPYGLRVGVDRMARMLPESTRGFHALRRLRAFTAGSLLDPVDMYASWVSHFTHAERQALYGDELRKELCGRDALDHIRVIADESGTSDPVTRAMYVDVNTFLPNNVLQYGDRMSMAHGLEARVPLADHRLIQHMAGAPGDLKVRRGMSKYLLRRCMARHLPEADVRRRKRGFNPPMGVWLNTSLSALVADYLSTDTLVHRGMFNPAVVQRMVNDHRTGTRDYTWHLWALVVLEQWQRQYLD